MSDPVPPSEPDALARGQVSRIAWLHFANDFTLDFITPLLPAGVGVAWIGAMEGIADGAGQVLKLFTGRASDRSGARAAWVRAGYVINAVARPTAGIGMLLGLPAWIIACRIADRVGKGVRGSATDALLADWSAGPKRAHAFARARTMDHLGATLGGLAAAAAAYALPLHQLWMAVCGLVLVTLWVAWLARGLSDRPDVAPRAATAPAGWWPRSRALRRPLLAIGIATLATKISPLLVLVQVASMTTGASSQPWPLWQACLGWAALGLVQAGAAAAAGTITAHLGPAAMLRLGWAAAVAVLTGLALVHGPWLIAVGLAYGVLLGFTEGAEKTWIAELAPKAERALSFGALALVTAITGLAGNAICGAALAAWGQQVFLAFAAVTLLAIVAITGMPGASAGEEPGAA